MVEVEPRAQQRLYELRAQPLREMHDWLELYRKVWDERFEALDGLLAELQSQTEAPPNKRGRPRSGRHPPSDTRATSRHTTAKESPHARRNRR